MEIGTRENSMLVNTHKTYKVDFFDQVIHTTVTHNPDVVTNWIDDTKYLHRLPGLVVGLDVEWRPYFSADHPNRIATLQLCVSDRCLIYQIIHSDKCIPDSLAAFLSREFNFVTFVGVGIKSDLEKLQGDYGIGGSAFYVDLRGLAAEEYGMKELETAGPKRLARIVLGKEVEKPEAVTMSRWDDRGLTAEQVQYACVDAYLSSELIVICSHRNVLV